MLTVRLLVRRDLPGVLHIEHASYAFPWSEVDFLSALRRSRCVGMVAEDAGTVVGFLIYETNAPWIDMVNVAVRESHRRQGVARRLIDYAKSKLGNRETRALRALISEDNLIAQLFFREQGFRATQIVADVAPVRDREAYLLQYRANGVSPLFIPRNRVARFLEADLRHTPRGAQDCLRTTVREDLAENVDE